MLLYWTADADPDGTVYFDTYVDACDGKLT